MNLRRLGLTNPSLMRRCDAPHAIFVVLQRAISEKEKGERERMSERDADPV